MTCRGAGVPGPPEIDAELGRLFRHYELPGLSVAIMPSGEIVFARGYGWASREQWVPATTEALFPIGSIEEGSPRQPFCAWRSKARSVSVWLEPPGAPPGEIAVAIDGPGWRARAVRRLE